MILQKKERRMVIAIGLITGVLISSLLVRHALVVKEEQSARKPGVYDSGLTALGANPFPPVPDLIRRKLPKGIVVHFESNRTSLSDAPPLVDAWVIETSGSFRSERCFVLVESSSRDQSQGSFFRASEIYLSVKPSSSLENLEAVLDEEQMKIIGQNRSTKEYILQVRVFSPTEIARCLNYLSKLTMVSSARMVPWESPR